MVSGLLGPRSQDASAIAAAIKDQRLGRIRTISGWCHPFLMSAMGRERTTGLGGKQTLNEHRLGCGSMRQWRPFTDDESLRIVTGSHCVRRNWRLTEQECVEDE